jgi:hypothetical protein
MKSFRKFEFLLKNGSHSEIEISGCDKELPVNVAINSRLLACKTYRVISISKHNPALRVSPYFQGLSSIL